MIFFKLWVTSAALGSGGCLCQIFEKKSVDVNDGVLAQNLCGKIMIPFYEAPHSIFCFDSFFWKLWIILGSIASRWC